MRVAQVRSLASRGPPTAAGCGSKIVLSAWPLKGDWSVLLLKSTNELLAGPTGNGCRDGCYWTFVSWDWRAPFFEDTPVPL